MGYSQRVALCLSVLAAAFAASAQEPAAASPNVIAVEHGVPFGVVPGKLLLLGNYMVFLDEQQLDKSLVIPKSAVESVNVDGAMITVTMAEGIKSRSGDVKRLGFRVLPGGDGSQVSNWQRTGGVSGSATASAAGRNEAAPAGASSYPARHDHRIGDCRGRLLFTGDQVNYESVSSADHSRRWEYRSIRELKLSNPYELELKPFTGESYKFKLDGSGMDPAAYRAIVDRVTSARVGR